MLNIDKIKLMSTLSLYADKEAKRNLVVNSYFKKDYISYHIIKSFLNVTISFILLVVIYILYQAEELISNIQNVDFTQMGILFLILYAISLTLYLIFTYFVYNSRYDKAKKNLKSYHTGLKRLNRMYELSDKTMDTKRED